MANSFLAAAGKKATDIRNFLKDAQGGNSIRYRAESGKKHLIYVPYVTVQEQDEDGNIVDTQSIVALYNKVHDWVDASDKYHTHVCLEGIYTTAENGEVINDGNCPFCDRVTAGWDIYKYRYNLEERTCGKTGTELTKHMEKVKSQLADERKSKDAKHYIYMLVAQFKKENNEPVMGQDGMPEYDLKIIKLSANRAEKIQNQLENAGSQLAGSELIFDYPSNDDIRQVVGQSTTLPVYPSNMLTEKYNGLKDKIDADVAKFVADEWNGLDKAFPEWSEMSTKQAKIAMDELYRKWDEYQAELANNPNAKYLEYGGSNDAISNPSLGVGTTQMGGSIQMPNSGNVQMGNVAQNGMPQIGSIPDVNNLFNSEDVHI